ncbi:MAG: NAD(P)H-hydrate dehydratase [Chloroflexota bacterium]
MKQISNHAKVVTVAQMQRIEKDADAQGHGYGTMMEMAGQAVAQAVEEQYVGTCGPVLILVGPGNNGGDGLVCAYQLRTVGIPCRVYLWRRSTAHTDDVGGHLGKLTAVEIEIAHADADEDLRTLTTWVEESEIIVDALLGTGNRRPIIGQLASILSLLQAHRRSNQNRSASPIQVVAVDCPSGLYCDSGELDPLTLQADLTVTFGYSKWGHHIFPGLTACGQVNVVNIGIPAALVDEALRDDGQTFLIQKSWVESLLPKRGANSHKGTFGKAMAAVGCVNYPGAAYLSLAAADRVGAGLVTGAVPQSIWSIVAAKLAEPTWLPLPDTSSGHLKAEGVSTIIDRLPGYDALLFGCGLGQTADTQSFIQALLGTSNLPPTVIDADGLNGLAQLEMWSQYLPAQSILTPHPAEMSRLCNMSIAEVTAHRWALARTKAAEWGTVILLKGPYTVIATPERHLAILPIATPALATAGTGDILSGLIVGLLTQGMAPFEAACAAAWLHGQIGLRCEQEIGVAGVIASDLIARIPAELSAAHKFGSAIDGNMSIS